MKIEYHTTKQREENSLEEHLRGKNIEEWPVYAKWKKENKEIFRQQVQNQWKRSQYETNKWFHACEDNNVRVEINEKLWFDIKSPHEKEPWHIADNSYPPQSDPFPQHGSSEAQSQEEDWEAQEHEDQQWLWFKLHKNKSDTNGYSQSVRVSFDITDPSHHYDSWPLKLKTRKDMRKLQQAFEQIQKKKQEWTFHYTADTNPNAPVMRRAATKPVTEGACWWCEKDFLIMFKTPRTKHPVCKRCYTRIINNLTPENRPHKKDRCMKWMLKIFRSTKLAEVEQLMIIADFLVYKYDP